MNEVVSLLLTVGVYEVWVGARDEDGSGAIIIWTEDATQVEPSLWLDGQPNYSEGHCVGVTAIAGGLMVINCDAERPVLCKV